MVQNNYSTGNFFNQYFQIFTILPRLSPTHVGDGGLTKCYTAGIMLLDLENPSKIIGMPKELLIVPEAEYERDSFRNDVIFPGGTILGDNGEVKIYYGANDTAECLAVAHVYNLIKLCTGKK